MLAGAAGVAAAVSSSTGGMRRCCIMIDWELLFEKREEQAANRSNAAVAAHSYTCAAPVASPYMLCTLSAYFASITLRFSWKTNKKQRGREDYAAANVRGGPYLHSGCQLACSHREVHR